MLTVAAPLLTCVVSLRVCVVTVYFCTHMTSTMYFCVISVTVVHSYKILLYTFYLTGSWLTDSQLKRTTRTYCCIYALLPPDDGLLASPKHVEV
jgi:hypothetical protein